MKHVTPHRTSMRLIAALVLVLVACTPAPLPPTPVLSPTTISALPSPTARPTPGRQALLQAPEQAEPLVPSTITISYPGYSGPATLRLYDSRGQAAGVWHVVLQEGSGSVSVAARGALGAQRAELLIDGRVAGQHDQLFTLDAQTVVATGQERFDKIYPFTRAFIEQSALSYELDGTLVHGYRSPDNPLLWLRDHTYQARGFRYFDRDVTSLINAFRQAQRADGSFPDWLARPEYGVLEPGRKEVEADIEYLFVQAVYEAWQATGDDTWLEQNLEAMRRALDYTMRDPLRWDAERQLVKRPFTIDTWDFSYGPTTRDPSNGQPAPRHWIDDQTIWGIFHGDNTGLAHALRLLAWIELQLGNPDAATQRQTEAQGVLDRLNVLSWNGSFYTHFVPLQPLHVPGVDTTQQLSLSNTIALNRNVLRSKQGRAIVEEYFRRGEQRGDTFAEWYSIDPPFPYGSYGLNGRPGEKPGEYVNGGIMPLVGGELARGAFRYGAEQYAFEILHRYYFLISTTGESYLWYYPAGNPGISGVDTLPTDGWGASAMLGALIEGAAGIEDHGALYEHVSLSPRWAATSDVRDARVVARYAASEGYSAYRWQRGARSITLEFTGSGQKTALQVLLPSQISSVTSVLLDGNAQEYQVDDVFGSQYVTLEVNAGSGMLEIQW